MTDSKIKNAKTRLFNAVAALRLVDLGSPATGQAWREVEDATEAVVKTIEEVYSRAYEHWREVNCKRHGEIERLKAELAETREDLDQTEQYLEEAQEALDQEENDFDQMQDTRQKELDEADKEIKHLRTALETLADRYHAQMCYKNRRYPHSREDCTYVLAVQEANEVLARPGGIVVGPDAGLTHGWWIGTRPSLVTSTDQVVDADELAEVAEDVADLTDRVDALEEGSLAND